MSANAMFLFARLHKHNDSRLNSSRSIAALFPNATLYCGNQYIDQIKGWTIWGKALGKGKRSSLQMFKPGLPPPPPPTVLFNGYGDSFPCDKICQGVDLTTHLHIQRMSGAIIPPPLYASWRGQGQLYLFALCYFSKAFRPAHGAHPTSSVGV
jgi:hypothetical protein